MVTPRQIKDFRKRVWAYYAAHWRSMPWRETNDPYAIMVSEIMLQQTQVSRVLTKYQEFMHVFPNFDTLAQAPVADVLRVWQGLGYNRRALNVRKLAQTIVREYRGKLPEHIDELKRLPGIGPGTAGSIATFAFNKPTVFIETNIRRVFIHHFFAGREGVGDKELLPLVELALDKTNPREWYFALMDYGAYLGKAVTNPNRRSRHYAKQSKFEGSDRQVRGEVLRQLGSGPKSPGQIGADTRISGILKDLEREGFIKEAEGVWMLA